MQEVPNEGESKERAMWNDELERLWNQQADEYNQWCDLGDDEKIEFAASVEREMSFDHQTAADLACGRPVSGEKARSFAQSARRTHDDRESLTRVIAELRREIALRDGEIVMLKGLLLERDDATPWQPIETAPKDGTRILLHFPRSGSRGKDEVVIGYWHQPGNPDQPGFWMGWGSGRKTATHWMPLPAPPSNDVIQGREASR